MSALAGFDQYSGSSRRIAIATCGAHVLVSTEGSDGNGQAMLTPEQARALAKMLNEAADSTAIGYAKWPEQEAS